MCSPTALLDQFMPRSCSVLQLDRPGALGAPSVLTTSMGSRSAGRSATAARPPRGRRAFYTGRCRQRLTRNGDRPVRLAASGTRLRHAQRARNERSASSTARSLASDGTLLRRRSAWAPSANPATATRPSWHRRTSAPRGRSATSASASAGSTAFRARRAAFQLAELTPGELTASRAVDRPIRPLQAMGQPADPGPAADAQLPHDARATAATTWSAPRPIDLPPSLVVDDRPAHRAARTASSPSRSSTGRRTTTRDRVGRARCSGSPRRRRDVARGRRRRRRSRRTGSTSGTSAWRVTRTRASSWRCSGRSTARRASDLPIHIAWGSPDGREWTSPQPTTLDGQHCQPIAIGGDVLVAAYTHRRNPPGVRVVRSAATSAGRGTGHRDRGVRPAAPATSRTPTGADSGKDYWNAMGAWQFGHPRGHCAAGRRGLRRLLCRRGRDPQRSLGARAIGER